MSGILDYIAEKDLRWELRFVRHREDFSPDFVRALAANPVDGILYSFDTVPTVEAELAKIDIPTIGLDVFDQSPLCGRTYLKCSRRLADLRFRELQGTSILEAIRKVQMEEVCRLLRTTNLSTSAIAEQTGFASAKHLPEMFKAAFGCSLSAYRHGEIDLHKRPHPF